MGGLFLYKQNWPVFEGGEPGGDVYICHYMHSCRLGQHLSAGSLGREELAGESVGTTPLTSDHTEMCVGNYLAK